MEGILQFPGEARTITPLGRGSVNAKQYETLMRPLNAARVATRRQGGKDLSYLEAWDVKAHLIRVFGFGNFDIEMIDQHLVGVREYQSSGDTPKPMMEAIWFAKVRLIIRDEAGGEIARYSEAAVGATSGPASMIGEHHDNAIKTAASDALKRCAINLGTQFGLSLYNDGSRNDVVKGTIVTPEGYEKPVPTAEQAAALATSVGTPGEAEAAKQDEDAEKGGS